MAKRGRGMGVSGVTMIPTLVLKVTTYRCCGHERAVIFDLYTQSRQARVLRILAGLSSEYSLTRQVDE